MQALVKGQKVDITKNSPHLTKIKVGLGWDISAKTGSEFDLDAVALLIGQDGRAISQNHVVYYNHLSEGNVSLSKDNRTGAGAGDDEEILIDLKQVPQNVEKIVLAISIFNNEKRSQTFGQVSNAFARIINEHTKEEMYRYDLGREFSNETCVYAGEVYRYKGEWKFGAVGRGIGDGLTGLFQQFGLVNLPPNFLVKQVPVKEAYNNNSGNKINLSKIELKKSGDVINLTKTSKPLGEVLVNLNWNQQTNKPSGGFFSALFGSANTGVDLDLGCLFEFKDGFKGCIQPLGNAFGSFTNEPFINLDQDDRTGASAGGENLRINGNKLYEFKRILLFAFIYEGAANWSEVDGIVTIKQQDGPDIVVRMDEHRNGYNICAVAMLENVRDETFKIEKLVKYFPGHKDMDRHYKWNMNWVHGSK